MKSRLALTIVVHGTRAELWSRDMMTEREYRMLGARMHRELNTGRRLAKCAAGVLMIPGAVIAGSSFLTPHQQGSEVAAAAVNGSLRMQE